ncbi:MAG TPA: hypothetical protein VFP42_14030 [Acidimicrobiia bacterium]|nr:hypothetical protein [Acidimicrobiia bacterium]
MEIAAIVAAVLMGVVAVFQLALALGAPAGFAAWGGWHEGVLPTRLRVASGVVGLIVYPALMVYVLATAGVIDATWVPVRGRLGMWILTVIFTVGGFANLASRSRRERWWAVAAFGIAVCTAIIAISL